MPGKLLVLTLLPCWILTSCKDDRDRSSQPIDERGNARSGIEAGDGRSTPSPSTSATSPPSPRPEPATPNSYLPVDSRESFASVEARLSSEKASFAARQQSLLEARYDLGDRPVSGINMSRGKPVQGGVRVRLSSPLSFTGLAKLSPSEIRARKLYPAGFLPLSHPKHEEGGQVLPAFHIKRILELEARDLQRFDVDFDLPDHFLPEFPAPIFLTTRPDLGDVSRGELVNIKNYFELFNGILTPRQLDGLRLLLTPFAQQQFNLTDDRRTHAPQLGISCLDCHANGHTNAATHLDAVTRPQEMRRRLDTPTLRGLNIQRLFGSQRALKSVEDFTAFEQLGAYFDGDHVTAAKKGFNKLDRDLQVAHMSEFQQILDFPPAPKLDVEGKLIAALASEEELRGQQVFFGKGKCASCHVPPYYTDNLMHDLHTERFHEPMAFNGKKALGDGPIKTFPLRGIKDSPPYLHDGRLLTLDDSVEFFNLVLGLGLTEGEKADLVAFMYAL